MSLLRTKIDPTTAKNIMYMCAAAPVLAFGARMVKSAMECVLTCDPRDVDVSEHADLLELPIDDRRRSLILSTRLTGGISPSLLPGHPRSRPVPERPSRPE